MGFVSILTDTAPFDWSPEDAQGKLTDTVFSLQLIDDAVDEQLTKRHTKPVFDKKQRKMVPTLDAAAYYRDVLQTAILDWRGLKDARTGQDVACTDALKALLPERVKLEIIRLCAGKEGGEAVAADQEKKLSATILSSKATNSSISSAA